MADIFHEVDEEVRRERLQKLWERYSIYIIGLAVLIVVAIGAWRGYEYWEAKKAATAGAAFEAALSLSEQGKHAEADAAFASATCISGLFFNASSMRSLSETEGSCARAVVHMSRRTQASHPSDLVTPDTISSPFMIHRQ